MTPRQQLDDLRARVTDRRGGIAFADPFRALEGSTDAVTGWERFEDERAEQALRTGPMYNHARLALAASAVPLAAAPMYAGQRWFRLAQDSITDAPTLRVGSAPTATDSALFSPTIHEDGPVLLQYVPSPDGNLVACVLARSPSAHPVVRIVSVDSRAVLADRIELHAGLLAPSPLAWLPDQSGFYYVAGTDRTSRWSKRHLYFHEIGTHDVGARETVTLDDLTAEPQVSSDGRYVALLTDTVGSPKASWIHEHGTSSPWRPFVTIEEGRCRGVFVGDRYVAVTTAGAPRGRLVSIPVATAADPNTWTEIVAESDAVLWSVSDTGVDLILAAIDDATMRLWIIDYDGDRTQEIAIPGPGAVGVAGPARSPGSAVVSASPERTVFSHQSHLSSPGLYIHDRGTDDEARLVEPPAVELDHLVTVRRQITASDGTVLPVQVTHRTDLDTTRPQPLLLTGYGGFGVADLPMFAGTFRPFIDSGGIYAWATIRGGGEFGDDWRDGGRLEHKERHYDDFCNVASAFIDEGVSSREQLVAFGASNGALLVAAAAIRRPELFAAVVAHLPFSDLMRYDIDDLGARWLINDWGDPADAATAPCVLAASPYHAIRHDVAYPPTLITFADQDDMATPWHARKLAARLAEASTNEVYLRAWRGLGHLEAAIGAPDLNAEWLSFLMVHAGLEMTAESDLDSSVIRLGD